jgi:methyl-accepting chemotaxis protein
MNGVLTIQRRLAIGFAIAPLILAIISAVIYVDTQGIIAKRALSRHSYDVLLSIGAIQNGMLDLETGQRGYLLTGDSAYLQPYQSARAVMEKREANLASLLQDNPIQRGLLTSLRNVMAQKVDELDETIGLRRERGFDAALAVVKTARGKTIMDQARAVIDQMRGEEMRLLDQRAAEAAKLEQLTLATVVFGTLFCFTLLAVVAVWTIRAITGPVRGAIEALAVASTQILAGATEQAAGMRQQASAVAETVTTVDEVLQTSEQAAQRANAVAESSQRASEVGAAGREAVLNTVNMMEGVREQSRAIAESILMLSERAQTIGEIIAAVSDIAEQTNLLALNAAIEASRAGEHGLAFSVVAGEIKALADQSKKSTAQVRQILGEIQKSTNAAVLVTEEGARGVDRAITTANEADGTISALVDTITEAAQAAAQIVASAGQQATGMGQIHLAMSQVREASTQSLAATRQSEQAAQTLHGLGRTLGAMVGARGG